MIIALNTKKVTCNDFNLEYAKIIKQKLNKLNRNLNFIEYPKIKPDFMDDRGTISDIFYQDKIDHVAYIKSFKCIRGITIINIQPSIS